MSMAAIQRQYDEVIAANYDLDPQSVTNDSLDRALEQLRYIYVGTYTVAPVRVLDVGMGTGLFYEKLRQNFRQPFQPFGLDISERMIAIASKRVPGLIASVDDAANLDLYFNEDPFDLVCTHFVTGFVPLDHLMPRIWNKLKPGGYWSFIGGTSGAFPVLQRKSKSRLVKALFGGRRLDFEGLLTPDNCADVVRGFRDGGFEVCASETFEPELLFRDFDEFMEFAYHGGWLTPFIQELGLHNIRPSICKILNAFVFPITDHHRIVIGLARKPVG
jgi:SAM-dependent methyltransferase